MKRFFDFSLAVSIIFLALPFMLLISIAIKIWSRGPILYWSERVGRYNRKFQMPKFRTMLVGTPEVAAHLLINPHIHITTIGTWLRKTSLDETPQLWSILIGDMSFVGPRPALFNQSDLIQLRAKKKINNILPGLSGLAQVNGRESLSIREKVKFDEEYLKKRSFIFDLKILYLTIINVIKSDGIEH